MTIYWVLFAFPALMALAYPVNTRPSARNAAQFMALAGFVVFYTLLAGLRHEIGGDWGNYQVIYDDIATDSFSYALTVTDPLYGLVNYMAAQADLSMYFVNGVCAFVLALGVARIAGSFRDPWLAITMAVPYLLIVVGLGYIRQGAAIGMLLLAISAFDRGKLIRTVVFLLMGVGFHLTAVMVFPLFALTLARRNRILAILLALASVAAYFVLVVPKFDQFNAGYIEGELESTGALPRILMSFIPSILLLLRRRNFGTSQRVHSIWLSAAVANVIAFVALALSPSSTAVDRAGLYFSIAQIAVFGEFRNLVPTADRSASMIRITLIGVAALVQIVWLVFATNAIDWVPYQSVFEVQ
jgi:EpsG family